MSATIRLYLVLTSEQVQQLNADKELPAAGVPAFAVTQRLIASLPGTQDEEAQEYAAVQQAAAAADETGRHVIAAADVRSVALRETGDPDAPQAFVEVDADIPMRRVVSLHLLDPEAERVDGEDFELSWYDITEIEDVIDEIRSR